METGRPPLLFDSQIDILAEMAGIDPLDFRDERMPIPQERSPLKTLRSIRVA